jgi:hypothetical protein
MESFAHLGDAARGFLLASPEIATRPTARVLQMMDGSPRPKISGAWLVPVFDSRGQLRSMRINGQSTPAPLKWSPIVERRRGQSVVNGFVLEIADNYRGDECAPEGHPDRLGWILAVDAFGDDEAGLALFLRWFAWAHDPETRSAWQREGAAEIGGGPRAAVEVRDFPPALLPECIRARRAAQVSVPKNPALEESA